MPRRTTTERRWLLTIVSFVAIASILEIGFVMGLFVYFGARVTGEEWLKSAAHIMIPTHLSVLHREMTVVANSLAEDAHVIATRDVSATAAAIRASWHGPPTHLWIYAAEDDGGAASNDRGCTHPELPSARSGAMIAWCGERPFIGVAVPIASGGKLFYGRALDDAYAATLAPLTSAEIVLTTSDGVVLASTLRSAAGDNELPLSAPDNVFTIVTRTLAEPYPGLGSSRTADANWPARGKRTIDWLVHRSILDVASTRPVHVLVVAPLDTLTRGAGYGAMIMLVIAFMVVLCAIVVARRIVVSFTRPITDVADAARRVALGETDVAVAERGDEEVASLARSFNQMVLDLNRSRARSVQADKMIAMGTLSAGIAHELNTPAQYVGDHLFFVRERVEEMLAEGQEPARLRELCVDLPASIEAALDGVRRMAKIVAAMKSFTHPSNGERELVQIRDVIETSAAVARNEWKYVAELNIDVDAQLPQISAVRDELGQALLNLIVNAAHAIEERQVLEHTSRRGTIAIRARMDGAWAEICIQDDGCGIPKQNMGRLFDAFFTTKRVGKGSGQGLPMVWSAIVERHHGSISVESELDHGTTFTIRLPLAADVATTQAPAAA